ncbi:MAG: type IV toxin-antitoxin system AbiEi family antitoxin [Bacteroidota bacterium]|nr:type IV toxin-antitoxin system AbiEi family antitoxin [Bacteroidota bacterium]
MNEQKYQEILKDVLARIAGLMVMGIRDKLEVGKKVIDFDVLVQIDGKPYDLMVEIKSKGTPLSIRGAIDSLRKIIPEANTGLLYCVAAAPFISDIGRQLCREAGVGCIDLAGNCYINFGSVYLEIKGNPNPTPFKPELSLFSPKSSRISRILLSNVSKLWQVQELAKEAYVSLGLASKIKDQLKEEGFLIEEGRLLKLTAPDRLLDAWSEKYSYKRNRIYEFYSNSNVATLKWAIQENCFNNDIKCALTLFSGAAQVAPHVRMEKVFIYVEKGIDQLAKTLDFKPVASGPNIMLLEPYDQGVFYKTQNVGKNVIVSNIQLYLDLKRYKGRGEEAASFLMQTKLKQELGI